LATYEPTYTPQGSFQNLTRIRAAGVKCPLLCKEFIVEAYQVFKARAR
jgi:indole-3-glycerol phosphate synthase